MQPLDTTLSAATRSAIIDWRGDGELTPRTGSPYPHVLLKARGAPWTSAFLALRTPPAERP